MKSLVGKMIVRFSFCLVSALIVPTATLAQKINIAVSNPDMSFLSGGVAKYKSFFKDEGLDVELGKSPPMFRLPRWPAAISTTT